MSAGRIVQQGTFADLVERGDRLDPLRVLQVIEPVPKALAQDMEKVQAGARDYQEISFSRTALKRVYRTIATEVANRVAYQAVQMHGGYGYMREFPVEGFFRDVRVWTIASGTSEMMREIIAKRMLA